MYIYIKVFDVLLNLDIAELCSGKCFTDMEAWSSRNVYTVSQIIWQEVNFVIFQWKKMLITMNFRLNERDQVTHLLCNFHKLLYTQS